MDLPDGFWRCVALRQAVYKSGFLSNNDELAIRGSSRSDQAAYRADLQDVAWEIRALAAAGCPEANLLVEQYGFLLPR